MLYRNENDTSDNGNGVTIAKLLQHVVLLNRVRSTFYMSTLRFGTVYSVTSYQTMFHVPIRKLLLYINNK